MLDDLSDVKVLPGGVPVRAVPAELAAAMLEGVDYRTALVEWADSLAENDSRLLALDGLDVYGLALDREAAMSDAEWQHRIEPLRRVVGALGLEVAARYLDTDGPDVLDDLRRGQRGCEYDVAVKVDRRLRENGDSFAAIARELGLPQSSVRDLCRTLGVRGESE